MEDEQRVAVTRSKFVPGSGQEGAAQINVALETSAYKQRRRMAAFNHGIRSIPDDRIGQTYFQLQCHRNQNTRGRHANHPLEENAGGAHISESTATETCQHRGGTETGMRMLSRRGGKEGDVKGDMSYQSRRTAEVKAQHCRLHS